MTVFASGLSRINDFRTYSRMGQAVGIVATDSSSAVLMALVEHNFNGLRTFVDNDAFGLFQRSRRTGEPPSMDFDRVFDIYRKILRSVTRKGLVSIVMPDVIGNQSASLQLIEKYRARIRSFIRTGADVLIPLQAGALSLAEVYERICRSLGSTLWRAAIPCNVKRIARRELFEFVSLCRPRGIHLLGVADHRKLYPLARLILDADSSADITADANCLRSIVDQEFTRRVRSRDLEEGDELACDLANYGGADHLDFTEVFFHIYQTPAYLTPAEAKRFALRLTSNRETQKEIISAALCKDVAPYCEEIDFEESGHTPRSHLGAWLDRHTYGDEGYYSIFGFCQAEARRKVPSRIRSDEIMLREKARRARKEREVQTLSLQGDLSFDTPSAVYQ